MERWVAKLLALFAMFTVILTSTLAPIKVSKIFTRLGPRGDVIVSYMMCFGGGVFLSAYTLHMAPDARDIINESLVRPYNIKYPVSDLIMVCGFLAMLLLDMTVHRHGMSQQRSSACQNQPRSDLVVKGEKDSKGDCLTNGHGAPTVSHDVGIGDRNAADGVTEEKSHQSSKSTCGNEMDGHGPVYGMSVAIKGQRPNCSSNAKQDPSLKYLLKDGKLITTHELEADFQHHENKNVDGAELHKSDHFTICPKESCRNSRSLILLMALSLDHVFEGLSIGLKRIESDVWSMCIAIIAHEIIIAFR